MGISTRDLSALPPIPELREQMRALAMLDAILCADWEYRYYSFDPAWAEGQVMASMRNGSGDDFFALFTGAGAGIVGLAHEATIYRMNEPAPGLFEGLPPELDELRTEPAFDGANSTFCIWRMGGDDGWRRGTNELPTGHLDPDGSADLLHILDGQPRTYVAFATDYYELAALEVDAVAAIYAGEPLTEALVSALDASTDFDRVREEAGAMGYPIG